MFYVIVVTVDVLRLGIAAWSEFQLPVEGKGNLTVEEYVEIELGLKEGEYERI